MKSNVANPFLFACGVPRSGTTLLQRMLNNHPLLAVANDTHFIPRALELTDYNLVSLAEQATKIELSAALAENVFSYHRFYRTGIESREYSEIRSRASTYRELVAGVFDAIATKSGKPFAGEKTPDYVRRLSVLHGLFPDAKLLHLIRDGRNVALSLLNWATPHKGPGRIELWNENPVAVCALWWKWLVDQGMEQSRRLNDSTYLEIRYEHLTEKPELTIRSLCEFLELPFDSSTLEYNRGKTSDRQGLSAKSAWLGPKPGLRNWRREMQPEEIELFEALAGDTLEKCGYGLSCRSISGAVQSAARRYSDWWLSNFLLKDKKSSSLKVPLNDNGTFVSTSASP